MYDYKLRLDIINLKETMHYASSPAPGETKNQNVNSTNGRPRQNIVTSKYTSMHVILLG